MAGFDEFYRKAAKLHLIPRSNAAQVGIADFCFVKLVFDERHREARAEHRRLKFFQRIRNCADVILMAMRNENPPAVFPHFFRDTSCPESQGQCRAYLHPENQAAIHYYDILSGIDYGHVLADLTHAAERDNFQLCF